jgi:hypothetical protein
VKINRQHARYIEKKRKKRFARINMTSFVLYTAQNMGGAYPNVSFPRLFTFQLFHATVSCLDFDMKGKHFHLQHMYTFGK